MAALLLEDGSSRLLLENGDLLLMEGTQERTPSDITQLGLIGGPWPYTVIGDKEPADAADPIEASDTASLTLLEALESFLASDLTDTASLTLGEALALYVTPEVTDTASLTLTELAAVEEVANPVEEASGGFFAYFQYERERARRERQKRIEDEEEAERIADETAREIAAYLHRQEALDAERRELERLKSLVDMAAREKANEAFSERVQAAYDRATENMTTSALLAFQRELERQMEEEEYAVLLLLLDD